MQNEINKVPESNIESNPQKQKIIVVKSFVIAQSLCVDYPYFKYLLYRKLDKDDPKRKKHIWLFEGHDEEFIQTFIDLCEQSRQYHRNRIRIEAEGNIDAAE